MQFLSLLHEEKDRSSILRFVANIILVTEGKRLSFRSDILDANLNQRLIKEALSINSDLIALSYPEREPLLFLKKNSPIIRDYLNRDNIHEAFGLVLEYPYIEKSIGPQFSSKGKIVVSYYVSYLSTTSQLYGFTIPLDEYKDDIKESVERRLAAYAETLSQYDISIELDIMYY